MDILPIGIVGQSCHKSRSASSWDNLQIGPGRSASLVTDHTVFALVSHFYMGPVKLAHVPTVATVIASVV